MVKSISLPKVKLNMKIEKINLLDMTCVMWFANQLLRAILSRASISGVLSQIVMDILIYTPLLIYVVLTKKIPWKKFHWVILICLLLFALTLLIHPDYLSWYNRGVYSIGYVVFRPDHGAIWAFLMVEISMSYERLLSNLKKAAVVIAAYNFYQLLEANQTGHWTAYNAEGELVQKSYSLDFGYNMIFIALVLLICYCQSKKKRYLIGVAVSVALALQQGSRGAFLCLIMAMLLYLIRANQTKIKRFFACVILFGIGAITYLYGNKIILASALFMINKFHVSSRTLTQIVSGNLVDSSGRDGIYELVLNAIKENPILGYGAYGDRPIVGPQYYWGYSHSIVYEMIINFGVILGGAILFFIVFKSLKLIFSCKDENTSFVVIVCFSMCMRLVVSDTFWGNIYFWIMLAFIFCNSNLKKEEGRKLSYLDRDTI